MTIRTTFATSFGEIEIGDSLPPHLIAEIGLNHNGSVELAKAMIRKAALSGASFVKFQKRSPADLATNAFLDESFEKCPALGRTQRQVRDRLELSLDEYKELRCFAESLGLIFFASAFDIPSFEFLQQVGISIVKIASHSLTHGRLLERVAASGLPVVCSFGGATEEERDQAFAILKDNPLVILHCVSAYPTPDHLIRLDTIPYLKKRYQVPIGFSSHEAGIDFSVGAAVIGAAMIERHFTLDRAMVGLDHSISLTPAEFAEMARRVKRLQNGRGINTGLLPEETTAKYNYHVAVCTTLPVSKGDVLTEAMLTCKQPLKDPSRYFSGLEYRQVIGRKVGTDIPADTPIARSDLR